MTIAYKKRYFLLMELCIALTLSAVIISTLMSYYSAASKAHQRLKVAKPVVVNRTQFLLRFNQIINSFTTINKSLRQERWFYTQDQALYFLFNNYSSPQAEFGGILKGCMRLTKEGELLLISWPLKKSSFCRKEVLLSDVSTLSYHFFSPQSNNKPVCVRDCNSSFIPPMMRITITHKGQQLSFAFFPANSPLIIPTASL